MLILGCLYTKHFVFTLSTFGRVYSNKFFTLKKLIVNTVKYIFSYFMYKCYSTTIISNVSNLILQIVVIDVSSGNKSRIVVHNVLLKDILFDIGKQCLKFIEFVLKNLLKS